MTDTTPKATPDDAGLVIEPCPFCGGEAAAHVSLDGAAWVQCRGCGVEQDLSRTSRSEAIAAWNARFERDMPRSARSGVAGLAYGLHAYIPHPKYPWFCKECGYSAHETLKHPTP